MKIKKILSAIIAGAIAVSAMLTAASAAKETTSKGKTITAIRVVGTFSFTQQYWSNSSGYDSFINFQMPDKIYWDYQGGKVFNANRYIEVLPESVKLEGVLVGMTDATIGIGSGKGVVVTIGNTTTPATDTADASIAASKRKILCFEAIAGYNENKDDAFFESIDFLRSINNYAYNYAYINVDNVLTRNDDFTYSYDYLLNPDVKVVGDGYASIYRASLVKINIADEEPAEEPAEEPEKPSNPSPSIPSMTPPTTTTNTSDNSNDKSISESNSEISETLSVEDVKSAIEVTIKNINGVINSGGKAKANVKLTNAKNITPEIAKLIVDAIKEAGGEAQLVVDSKIDGAIETRITLDASKIEKELNLLASQTSKRAEKSKKNIEKKYKNDVAVLSFEQRGEFGQTITVATKVKDLNTDNLKFYAYDPKAGKIKQLKVKYTVDKNGYVHFKTSVGYDIVISDGSLEKR